ncbi:dihydroxy-acid dehydratase, partial [Pseudoalteromonas lipolytica]
VENGDKIIIDIATREITLALSDEELEARKQKQLARGKEAFKPRDRERYVSSALKAYALLATSADKGAVRDLAKLEELS